MNWRPGNIIRHIKTGQPLLVLHSYRGATVVVDLMDKSNPTPSSVLLERDYPNWLDEKKMACQEQREIGWYEEPKLTWGLATTI